MKNSQNNLLTGILIFTIGLLAAGFSQFYPETKMLIRITFIISLIYLTLGWYIFRSYFGGGNPLLLFIMGYLYSGIFMAAVFKATGWPLSSSVVSFAPIWVLGQIILLITLRKKISKEGFAQFLIETGLLVVLTVALLVRL